MDVTKGMYNQIEISSAQFLPMPTVKSTTELVKGGEVLNEIERGKILMMTQRYIKDIQRDHSNSERPHHYVPYRHIMKWCVKLCIWVQYPNLNTKRTKGLLPSTASQTYTTMPTSSPIEPGSA